MTQGVTDLAALPEIIEPQEFMSIAVTKWNYPMVADVSREEAICSTARAFYRWHHALDQAGRDEFQRTHVCGCELCRERIAA